jgi:2-dehydro-3-deoxygluconokinase
MMPDDWSVAFHTGLGTDQLSDDMIDFMASHHISCVNIPRIENRTAGLYVIQLHDGERSFSYWRNESAARLMMRDPALLADKLASARFIYLSGITLAILSADDRATLLGMIKSAKNADKTVFFDSNIRPKLWPNADEMRSAISEAGGVADIIMPSLDDEKMAFGDSDDSDVAARYLALGAKAVIVKNSAASALLATASGHQHFAPSPVDSVIDSTAAGDAFNGAFMARMAAGDNMEDAIKAAHKCAAIVVRHIGALAPKHLFTF